MTANIAIERPAGTPHCTYWLMMAWPAELTLVLLVSVLVSGAIGPTACHTAMSSASTASSVVTSVSSFRLLSCTTLSFLRPKMR